MNKLAITLGIIAVAGIASADLLHDNGSTINQGTNLSVITAPNSTFGYGAQIGANNRMADDFSVSGGPWTVNRLCFVAYQTNATAYTMTDVSWAILSGADVNTATSVASGTTASTAGALLGYRVSSAATGTTNRPMYEVNVATGNINLANGTYWVVWSMGGTLSSGPWVPQVMDGVNPKAGNGQQSINGAAFAAAAWGTAGTSELPFSVHGTAVPEPATMIALAAGLAAAARRRRK